MTRENAAAAAAACPTAHVPPPAVGASSSTDRCVLFFHVPKTAGVSVTQLFRKSRYRLEANPSLEALRALSPATCRGRTYIEVHAVS